MTAIRRVVSNITTVSTHMPLARHDMMAAFSIWAFCTFLLTCLLRGMTYPVFCVVNSVPVSTHMPLARHDAKEGGADSARCVSTHMPLARHDSLCLYHSAYLRVSTHMPLARHDAYVLARE